MVSEKLPSGRVNSNHWYSRISLLLSFSSVTPSGRFLDTITRALNLLVNMYSFTLGMLVCRMVFRSPPHRDRSSKFIVCVLASAGVKSLFCTTVVRKLLWSFW